MPTIKKLPKKRLFSDTYDRDKEANDPKRKERQKYYQNKQWRAMRDAYLSSHPLCECCAMQGKVVAAIDIHHLDSFTNYKDETTRLTKLLDWDNLMALSKQAHRAFHWGEFKNITSKEQLIEYLKQRGRYHPID